MASAPTSCLALLNSSLDDADFLIKTEYLDLLLQEGLAVVENRTADIIQETRKLQIRKKDGNSVPQNNASNISGTCQQPLTRTHMQPQTQTDLETQLKASRDVRWQLCDTGLAINYHALAFYMLDSNFIEFVALLLRSI